MTANRPIQPRTVAIVGAGRVGTTLGILLRRSGLQVVGASARSEESVRRAETLLGCRAYKEPADAVRGAEIVIVAVPDAAVQEVCDALARSGSLARGVFIFHTAGALGLAPLRSARAAGAIAAAIHPLQSIPDVEAGVKRIPGSWFGTTCEPEATGEAESIVCALGGKVLTVREQDRPLYHLGAVIASNFLVALASMASTSTGSLESLLPLMKGTLENISELGPEAALTGPVTRGDVATITEHLLAIRERIPQLDEPYRVLSAAILEMALQSGRLGQDRVSAIRTLLEQNAESHR